MKVFGAAEKDVIISLLGMIFVAVVVATIELAVVLVQELLKPPVMLLNLEELLEVFGFFLMVLIGIELMETIKAYLHENRIQAEVVFLAALVAISRKIIIIDYDKLTPAHLFGLAAVLLALGITYFLVRTALGSPPLRQTEARFSQGTTSSGLFPSQPSKTEQTDC
jgi:uncharacterized membrane protein (DUF373 family)